MNLQAHFKKVLKKYASKAMSLYAISAKSGDNTLACILRMKHIYLV